MTGRPATPQENGMLPSETESLRRARLGVWESEGGGLGRRHLPLDERAEVVFDGVTILTSPGAEARAAEGRQARAAAGSAGLVGYPYTAETIEPAVVDAAAAAQQAAEAILDTFAGLGFRKPAPGEAGSTPEASPTE
jgi:hypothetical protein